MTQGRKFENIQSISLTEVRKALKNDGECIIGSMEITVDSLNNCEVTENGELLFECTSWYELEEYLEDLMWNA